MTNTKKFKLVKLSVLSFILCFIINVTAIGQTNNKADELHRELNNDNIEKVKEIINQDISLLETPNPRGSTPLIVASADGHTELVKFFIKKGADINKANDFGNTPLHYAAWASDFEAFKYLFDKGANIKSKNSRGQTPLQYSCMGGNFEIMKYCVSKGMDIKTKCDDETSLIHWAAYGGNLEMFKYLESQGLDFNIGDKDGSTPIFWAASGNRIEIIKYLVEEKNVDVNFVDESGTIPLKSAIEGGHYEVAKYLLEKGADINYKMDDNVTWLQLAAQNNNPELIKMLTDKGCKVNVFDDDGNTPLTTAAAHGNLEVVKILVENDAKLEPGICKRETCTNRGLTPLHAASWRQPSIMEYLIEKGADPNVKNLEGNTPMHNVTWSDSVRSVDILCNAGGNVNTLNNRGLTPLMMAIKKNKTDLMKAFLKNKADLSIADNDGKTALHYAAIAGYGNVVDELIENGADIHAKDQKGRTPAHFAVYHGNKKIADNFFNNGASKKNIPFKKADLLNKELAEGEAFIWYLNHSGWVVKTKNHLLVFDYWQRENDPDFSSINNGRINTDEIGKQDVMVFVSHTHGDHYSRDIFEWDKNIKDINYVLGFETDDYDDYTYIPPRNNKTIDNVKITAISSTDSGEGFMLEVDGLTICHPGDHANRYQEGDAEFSDEIDFLAEKYNDIDIAFVPITGCGFRDKVALFSGNDYLVKSFNPKLVLPMHGSNSEHKYKEYAEDKNKEGNTSIYKYVLNKGDRLYYEKQDNKLGYSK